MSLRVFILELRIEINFVKNISKSIDSVPINLKVIQILNDLTEKWTVHYLK